MVPQEIFDRRASLADERIAALRSSLAEKMGDVPESKDHPTLCVYATGSLARREASENSDLDAFFLLTKTGEQKPLGRIRDVKILNAVLDAAEEGGFPDFSNDGEFLKFLYSHDVVDSIGSREDDYKIAFTARMLLLLESTHIYGEDNYQLFLNSVIDKYFTDFHKHTSDFRPIFLLNDVLRFWRTLCINYEHGRHWRGMGDPEKIAKGHLDNLKLKFSRLNICYSFICHLMVQGGALSQDSVKNTVALTPLKRLQDIRGQFPDSACIIEPDYPLDACMRLLYKIGHEQESFRQPRI